MAVPLLLGAIVNTFFGNVLWSAFDGTFTTYLWKSGAMPILAVFIFCNATTINFKKAGVTIYKGVVITGVKVGIGIIIGLICGSLFGEKGFLGIVHPGYCGRSGQLQRRISMRPWPESTEMQPM